MFSTLDISGSAMTANKEWLEVISNNLSNMNTTRSQDGSSYKRQAVVFEEIVKENSYVDGRTGAGTKVTAVLQDDRVQLVYDPDHPDANEDGYVEYPEINMTSEMTDMLMAQRGYEANSSVLTATKQLMEKVHEIGKV